MIPFKLLPNIYFFLIPILFPPPTIAQGKLALYLDFDCRTPSQLLPTVSLPLSTCLVPEGAVSIAIDLFPSCDSGTANMIMYEDTSCSRNVFSNTNTYTGWSDISNCFYLYISKSVPAVMFTCDEPATDPQPTSTSSVTASIVAGVATGGGSQAITASNLNVAATTTTSTSASNGGSATSSPTSGSKGTSGSSSGSASSTGSSGLDMSDKIAIGVGVGVGVPSILIGLVAWLWPRS